MRQANTGSELVHGQAGPHADHLIPIRAAVFWNLKPTVPKVLKSDRVRMRSTPVQEGPIGHICTNRSACGIHGQIGHPPQGVHTYALSRICTIVHEYASHSMIAR